MTPFLSAELANVFHVLPQGFFAVRWAFFGRLVFSRSHFGVFAGFRLIRLTLFFGYMACFITACSPPPSLCLRFPVPSAPFLPTFLSP